MKTNHDCWKEVRHENCKLEKVKRDRAILSVMILVVIAVVIYFHGNFN